MMKEKPYKKPLVIATKTIGLTLYVTAYAYVILRIFYELFFTPIYFITRGYELTLMLILFNAFCFWPLLVPSLTYKILKRNLLVTVFTYLFIFLIGTTNLEKVLAKPLEVSDKLSKADAIIVLDAGYVDIRFAYGAELYRRGYAGSLVTFMPEIYGRFLAKNNGVPPEKVFYLSGGVNTHKQAVLAKRLFDERGWRKGILVTNSYHMLRARQAFRKQGLEVMCAPVPDSIWYGQPGRFINKWSSGKKLEDYSFWDRFAIRHTWMMQILHEYTGLLYYCLRGYI